MNILFVCPKISERFAKHPRFLPLGVAYLAAILEQDGHQVEVLDLSAEKCSNLAFQDIVSRGYYRQPPGMFPNSKGFKIWDIIGFTVVTPTANQVYALAELAKESSNALIVAGGLHVTALPEEALRHAIDIVVHGEGEETIRELCDCLDRRKREKATLERLAAINGISYRETLIQERTLHYLKKRWYREDCQILHTPARYLISDLDDLPFPARHLFPLEKYIGQPIPPSAAPIGNLITSRGDPSLASVDEHAAKPIYRSRSIENILAEWRELIERYHVREIAISDDLFTADPERAIALCERVIAERLVLPWTCPNGIRIDTLTADVLHAMKRAGCYHLTINVGAGSQPILDTLCQPVTLHQIKTAFAYARNARIKTTAIVTLGNPGDTRETMQRTLEFTQQLGADFAKFITATPYPGTALYELVRATGKFLIADWDLYDEYAPGAVFFEMRNMQKSSILRMQRRAYWEFYLQPDQFMRKLVTRRTYKYFRRAFQEILKSVLHR